MASRRYEGSAPSRRSSGGINPAKFAGEVSRNYARGVARVSSAINGRQNVTGLRSGGTIRTPRPSTGGYRPPVQSKGIRNATNPANTAKSRKALGKYGR
jgi:hypothetical protein